MKTMANVLLVQKENI